MNKKKIIIVLALKNRVITKVMCRSSQVEDETWKRESKIKKKYLDLFLKEGNY
jgi:hypothetical protein